MLGRRIVRHPPRCLRSLVAAPTFMLDHDELHPGITGVFVLNPATTFSPSYLACVRRRRDDRIAIGESHLPLAKAPCQFDDHGFFSVKKRRGLLVRSLIPAHNPHAVVLKFEFVMRGIDFNIRLSSGNRAERYETKGRHKDTQRS